MEDKVIFNTGIEDAPKVEVPKAQKRITKQTKIRTENSEDMGNYLTGAGQCNAQIIIIDNITGNIEAVMTF